MMKIMVMNCFCSSLADQKRLALFPTENIVRDSHHRESQTRRKQGLNLRRTWILAVWNEVVL